MVDSKPDFGKNWTIFRLVAALLILNFLWRALVTAHEYPPRSSQVLTFLVDALLLVSLVMMRSQWSAAFDENDPRRTTGGVLFGVALAAGIGLFLIRLTSDSAWWTGHLFYALD